METKYTPGPWSLKKDRENVYKGGSLTLIASVYPIGENDELIKENQANCKLIGMAPELLEAMIEFCNRVDHGEVRSIKTYSKFKELIKKATE